MLDFVKAAFFAPTKNPIYMGRKFIVIENPPAGCRRWYQVGHLPIPIFGLCFPSLSISYFTVPSVFFLNVGKQRKCGGNFPTEQRNIGVRNGKEGHIMALEQYPDILTVEELCSVLNIGANSAYELLNKGIVPAFRIGRRWKMPKESVISYIGSWKH